MAYKTGHDMAFPGHDMAYPGQGPMAYTSTSTTSTPTPTADVSTIIDYRKVMGELENSKF